MLALATRHKISFSHLARIQHGRASSIHVVCLCVPQSTRRKKSKSNAICVGCALFVISKDLCSIPSSCRPCTKSDDKETTCNRNWVLPCPNGDASQKSATMSLDIYMCLAGYSPQDIPYDSFSVAEGTTCTPDFNYEGQVWETWPSCESS